MNRSEKVSHQLKREISQILHDEVKDPRIGFITVTKVEITRDLRFAKIYYSVLGTEKDQEASNEALVSAKGFIRGLIGRRLQLRFTPEIDFVLDKSSQYSFRIEQVLDSIKEDRKKKDK